VELRVATSAARCPHATNYLSILTANSSRAGNREGEQNREAGKEMLDSVL
jgi:hypothetical protein